MTPQTDFPSSGGVTGVSGPQPLTRGLDLGPRATRHPHRTTVRREEDPAPRNRVPVRLNGPTTVRTPPTRDRGGEGGRGTFVLDPSRSCLPREVRPPPAPGTPPGRGRTPRPPTGAARAFVEPSFGGTLVHPVTGTGGRPE